MIFIKKNMGSHGRVRVQKVRDFPQTKHDHDVNAPFLLNKDGDLYFLLHKNIAHIMLFNLKKNKENLSEGKKDIIESMGKTVNLTCKL